MSLFREKEVFGQLNTLEKCFIICYVYGKSGGARTKQVRGGQTKWSTFMYIISGRGRKSGGAHATGATPSLAPLSM